MRLGGVLVVQPLSNLVVGQQALRPAQAESERKFQDAGLELSHEPRHTCAGGEPAGDGGDVVGSVHGAVSQAIGQDRAVEGCRAAEATRRVGHGVLHEGIIVKGTSQHVPRPIILG